MEKRIPEFVKFALERSSHPFHMWDGIVSIPSTLESVLTPEVRKEVQKAAAAISKASTVHLLGCGSSYFSGIAGTYTFNQIAGISAQARSAGDFASYPPAGLERSALIAISHTGGTPVVLDSVKLAANCGAPTVGLTDVPGSPLDGAASHVLLAGGGREPALPKTRSYVASLLKHYLLAVETGAVNGQDISAMGDALDASPGVAKGVLQASEAMAKQIGMNLDKRSQVFILGTGPNVATAFEGALKLQEVVQVPAHAWELEEGMHGPWVTIESGDLVIVVATSGPSMEKARAFIASLRPVGAKIWAISDSTTAIPGATYETRIPANIPEYFSPLYTILPLYQFTYYLALGRGLSPDAMRLTDDKYLTTRLNLPR